MFEMWRAMLLEIGFMSKEKEEHMMMGMRRIFSRGTLTVNDVRIMMGVARQSRWAAKRGGSAQAPAQEDGVDLEFDEARP